MNWKQASTVGLNAAAKALRTWKVDAPNWVDVFDVAAAMGIGLLFRPTKNLNAALLSEVGSAQGIIVNSNHPLTRQRYSVAHELGHLFFGHPTTIDTDDIFLEGRSERRSKEEKLAESFASWFLMPPYLLDEHAKRRGLARLQTADQVYQLSLALGTSYEATVHHLRYTGRATPERAKAWLKETPAKIKRKIAGDYIPENAWSDVHLLSERDSGGSRLVRSGDHIVLEFSEIPSTGYRWSSMPLAKGVRLLFEGYAEALTDGDIEARKTGIARTRRIVVSVDEVEQRVDLTLGFQSIRAWLPDDAVNVFKLALAIEPKVRLGVPERYFTVAA